jgi:hypothetical protein
MNCPFCKNPLLGRVEDKMGWSIYFCDVAECMLDDMARYEARYSINGEETLIAKQFIFNNDVCVNVDYVNNCTVISHMIAYFLVDSFQVPRDIEIDMDDPYSSLPKIETLMTFS